MSTSTRNVFANRVGVAALIVCYAVTRFVALTKLPIFIDEATFIHFAMRVWHGNPFEIVPFGKLLHVWLIALVIPWASSPLWAARAVTAFGDGLALYACLQIGTKLYDRPTGFLCAALYIICPFTLFHDRLALADGLASAFAALTLLSSIVLVKKDNVYSAALVGLAMSGAILSKMSGLLSLLTPLVIVIFLAKSPRARLLRRLALSYGITLALTAFPIVRFWLNTTQTRFSIVGENARTLPDARTFITQVETNVHTAYDWLWIYWTPPVLAIVVAGLVFSIVRRKREHMLLWTAGFIPAFAFIVVSKIWFPRYLLPATVPVLAFVAGIAYDLTRLSRISKFAPRLQALPSIVFFVAIALFSYRLDWSLLTNPATARIPLVDRIDHIELWPSGYGVAEAAEYLREAAQFTQEGIVVVHHEYGDNIDFGLEAYLLHEKRIEFRWAKLRNTSEITTVPTLVEQNQLFA